jgi:hypothetical protein
LDQQKPKKPKKSKEYDSSTDDELDQQKTKKAKNPKEYDSSSTQGESDSNDEQSFKIDTMSRAGRIRKQIKHFEAPVSKTKKRKRSSSTSESSDGKAENSDSSDVELEKLEKSDKKQSGRIIVDEKPKKVKSSKKQSGRIIVDEKPKKVKSSKKDVIIYPQNSEQSFDEDIEPTPRKIRKKKSLEGARSRGRPKSKTYRDASNSDTDKSENSSDDEIPKIIKRKKSKEFYGRNTRSKPAEVKSIADWATYETSDEESEKNSKSDYSSEAEDPRITLKARVVAYLTF